MAQRSARLAVGLGSLLLAAVTLAMVAAGGSVPLSAAATAVWGFAFGALPVGFQTWNTRAAGEHAESAGALLVTAFQVAIATGAVLGGLFVDGAGAPGPIAYCGIAVLLGGLTMLLLGRAREPRLAR